MSPETVARATTETGWAVLINRQSGTIPGDAAELASRFIRQFDGADAAVAVHETDGSMLEETVLAILETPPDALLVWGGDGTIACALAHAGERRVPVFALPGGTMNLLPKRFHDGETDWRRCLEASGQSLQQRTLPAGEVQEAADPARFYIAALLGDLTALSRSRESIRSGDLVTAIQELTQSDALTLETNLHYACVDMATGREITGEATALAVVVQEGPPAHLMLLAIDPDSVGGLAGTGFDVLLKGWEAAEAGIERVRTDAVQVTKRGGENLKAALDGEECVLPSRCRFRILPSAASVLVVAAK